MSSSGLNRGPGENEFATLGNCQERQTKSGETGIDAEIVMIKASAVINMVKKQRKNMLKNVTTNPIVTES